MNNNDILRRIRYIFDFSDAKMIGLFSMADLAVTQHQLHGWLKKEDEEGFSNLSDYQLTMLLNGLISDKRGRQGDVPLVAESHLTNNAILRKIKIALDLKADDILQLLELAGMRISKHELSALFRKKGHRQYRECKDQIMRNFLSGLQLKLRGQAVKGAQDPATNNRPAKQPNPTTNPWKKRPPAKPL